MIVLVGPSQGGVAHVARMLVEHWSDGSAIQGLLVSDRGDVVATSCSCTPVRSTPWSPVALRAVRGAWAHRRCLRAASSLHVELGRTSVGAFWFALAAAYVSGRAVVVGTHDVPVVVNHPGAAVLHQAPGWWDRLAFRVAAPLLDGPLVRLLRRRTVATVVLSRAAAKDAVRAGWAGVVVAAHGAAGPTATRPPSAGSYVLLAGFLGPGKGLDVLADAWSQVRTDLSLVIAGGTSDPHRPWVDAVRARFEVGPNPPRWLGLVDDATFAQLIRDAAVVVLPYEQSNPASGVLVRALVEGRAIVATRVAAFVDEVVDGADALLVDPGDAAQLAAALTRVCSSAELRDRLGAAAAAAAAQRHTWASHVATIAEAHRGAAPGRPPARATHRQVDQHVGTPG